MLDSKTVRAENGEKFEKHLLLTRYNAARAARGEMLKVDDVLEILAIPLLGIIPENPEVLNASNLGCPITLHNPASPAARAYTDAARRLLGETVAVDAPAERRGFLSRSREERRPSHEHPEFFHRNRSAPVARERLQILLAHERALTGQTDLAAILQEEILAVIAKHIAIDRDKVNVKLDRGKQFSTLEIDIEMPEKDAAEA